jgi:hypothetical protein
MCAGIAHMQTVGKGQRTSCFFACVSLPLSRAGSIRLTTQGVRLRPGDGDGHLRRPLCERFKFGRVVVAESVGRTVA